MTTPGRIRVAATEASCRWREVARIWKEFADLAELMAIALNDYVESYNQLAERVEEFISSDNVGEGGRGREEPDPAVR